MNTPYPSYKNGEAASSPDLKLMSLWERNRGGKYSKQKKNWGGDRGIRTPDILLAKQALYQLSYIPSDQSIYYSFSKDSTRRLNSFMAVSIRFMCILLCNFFFDICSTTKGTECPCRVLKETT
jgi:hypothetical protein